MIRYLASTIAHKEKVIIDLTRKLEEAKASMERYRDYWIEDSAELKKLQDSLTDLDNPKSE